MVDCKKTDIGKGYIFNDLLVETPKSLRKISNWEEIKLLQARGSSAWIHKTPQRNEPGGMKIPTSI